VGKLVQRRYTACLYLAERGLAAVDNAVLVVSSSDGRRQERVAEAHRRRREHVLDARVYRLVVACITVHGTT